MRPRIQARQVEVRQYWPLKPYFMWMGWEVFWAQPNGRMKRDHFWTYPAALDFALERVAESRKQNHLHLWS